MRNRHGVVVHIVWVLIGRRFFQFHVGDVSSDSGHTGGSLDGKARAFPKQHLQRRNRRIGRCRGREWEVGWTTLKRLRNWQIY